MHGVSGYPKRCEMNSVPYFFCYAKSPFLWMILGRSGARHQGIPQPRHETWVRSSFLPPKWVVSLWFPLKTKNGSPKEGQTKVLSTELITTVIPILLADPQIISLVSLCKALQRSTLDPGNKAGCHEASCTEYSQTRNKAMQIRSNPQTILLSLARADLEVLDRLLGQVVLLPEILG